MVEIKQVAEENANKVNVITLWHFQFIYHIDYKMVIMICVGLFISLYHMMVQSERCIL